MDESMRLWARDKGRTDDLVERVANDSHRPAWKANSFFRRFAKQG